MSRRLDDQAARLYRSFAELVRCYQYRDREEVCCHDVSVTQCHVLEDLQSAGSRTMGELAQRMRLDLSTMTRAVDRLVEQGRVRRAEDPADRRVRRVEITRAGRALVARIQRQLIAEHLQVLSRIPAGDRESVITAIDGLREAFLGRMMAACSPR